MPIYEYQCNRCDEIFEIFQGIKDAPLEKCKHCSGKVTKLISNCTFQLKGTGWYLTDYARKETPEAAENKRKEAKATEKKTGDTKGAEKKEAKKAKKTD